MKNKKIILVDDSLVRGTTSLKIVKMLYNAGVSEVHVRIACPKILYPDFYGVDMPTKVELLASNKNTKEMCNYIKATSLKFLSIDGLYNALGKGKIIPLNQQIILKMKKSLNYLYLALNPIINYIKDIIFLLEKNINLLSPKIGGFEIFFLVSSKEINSPFL